MMGVARWEGLDQATVEDWGRRIGAEVRGALTIALEGPLGAGKSVFARAIARGAGVEGDVPSPTYTLLNQYAGAGGREVVHIDLYRIRHPDELLELGWEELGGESQIVLIEWPDRAEARIPADRWVVALTPDAGQAGLRSVEAQRVGMQPDLPLPVSVG